MRLGWVWLSASLAAWLAACGTPECPPGSTYSPLFGQCVGVEEEREAPPPAHSASVPGTADTGAGT